MRVVLATCRPFSPGEGPLALDDQLLHQTLTLAQIPVDKHQLDYPPPDEVAIAQKIMRVVEQMLGCGALLYGRVDLVRDGGQLYLMELTEPLLHLEYGGASERLTEAIVTRLAHLLHPLPTW